MRGLPEHLQTAVKIAEANTLYPKFPFGSVLVKGGNIRGIGMNRLHTRACVASDEHLHKLSTHAEEDALRRSGVTKGGTMYIARIGRNGKVALARPCERCVKALRDARVRRAVYTIAPSEHGVLNLT